MTTAILKISQDIPRREEAVKGLRDAGIGVVEVDNWEEAARALGEHDKAVVLCSDELDPADMAALAAAIRALGAKRPGTNATSRIPPDVARALSHELRTPLSAMAGWLHLLETGKLDDAGIKKAINKLRGNIDDQVRTIDRYLGVRSGGRS